MSSYMWHPPRAWLLLFALFPFTVSSFGTHSLPSQGYARVQLFLEPKKTNVFQECDTIACVQEQWVVGARKIQLNVTAVALKRTTQLVLAGQQETEAFHLLPDLLHALDQQIMKDQEPYPVVAVTSSLISLSALMTSPYYSKEEDASGKKPIDWDALARRWWNQMQMRYSEVFVSSQKPHLLVKLLRMGLLLGWNDDELYISICQRLAQGDALARIHDNEMIRTILSFSHQERELAEEETVLLKSYLRRVRKYNVRTELDRTVLVQILKAIQKLFKVAGRFQMSDDLTKELRVTYYTLAAEFFKATESTEDDSPTSPSEAYLLWQVSRDLSLNPDDALRTTIMNRLEANSKYLIQKATLRELALLSDVFLLSSTFKTAQIVRRIGQVLENDPTVVSGEVHPWIISSVLRYAVLAVPKTEETDSDRDGSGKHGLVELFRRPPVTDRSNELLVVPFKKVLLGLIQRPDFLRIASAEQIANFLWFFHSVRLYNKDAIFALGNRILDPDVSSNCSPKVACRLLGSFTSIFFFSDDWDDPGNVDERQDLLSRIFSALGEHLLTVNMSVLDISTALYAYGKASFVQDMGVIDHLTTQLADRIRKNDETVTLRQIAQSLWACGKMCGFESAEEEEMNERDQELPFVEAAFEMARYLGVHSPDLTSRDVTQSLWALGMLQISDPDVTRPLIRRAQDLAHELNTQEVANILLALSRIKSEEFKAIFDLTRRFTDVDIKSTLTRPSTQEAANIIYSLGRLNIRDEEVFKYLSSILMENIGETSAQAIANVLWAHRIVHIPPPRELLDRWTIKKLGLVSVQTPFDLED